MSTTPQASTTLRSPTLQRAFAAFTYRDFRVLWFGAFSSTVGTWMQKVAQSWLIFDLTNSSFYLGLDDFLGQLPILLFTLVGGVIADRHDRKRLLLGSQFVQMATAFALAALVFQGRVHIGHILALSFTTGLAQAFGGPAYQAMIPSLIHKKDLPNAIALNSIQFNLARVFGPLLAGVTMAALGAAGCFTLNGVSFLIVIVALMSLSLKHIPPTDRKPMVTELKGGFEYARSEPAIVALTILASITTFLGLPLLTFLPVFAREIFHGDVGRFSWMMAFSGMGAVTGALVIAWLGRFKHMGLALLMIQLVCGAFITALRVLADLLAQLPAALLQRRRPAHDLFDDVIARAADRPRSPARARRQHLHGGVPRRDAPWQPGQRLRRQPSSPSPSSSASTGCSYQWWRRITS